jgi:hypothetical protein
MPKNVYQPFYPVDPSAITDFKTFATTLATALQGKVLGYEC